MEEWSLDKCSKVLTSDGFMCFRFGWMKLIHVPGWLDPGSGSLRPVLEFITWNAIPPLTTTFIHKNPISAPFIHTFNNNKTNCTTQMYCNTLHSFMKILSPLKPPFIHSFINKLSSFTTPFMRTFIKTSTFMHSFFSTHLHSLLKYSHSWKPVE